MQPVGRRAKALGHPRVWIESRSISKKAWGSRRAQELFFLLIDHPAGLTKDRMVASLFPESDEGDADGLFHSTLYRCRKALGKDAILWEDDIYRIRNVASWRYDVAEFEALVKEASGERDTNAEQLYRGALQLYEGDYLEGWVSEWCEPTRLRMRQMYVKAALGVARSYEDHGWPEKALEFYRLAIRKEYYSEPGHRGVTDSLLALGDRLGAVGHYLELVDRLKQDVPPEERSEIPALVDDMLGRSLRDLLTGDGGAQCGLDRTMGQSRGAEPRQLVREGS